MNPTAAPVAPVAPVETNPTPLRQHHDITKFASTDASRYALNGVFVDGEYSRVVATNGTVLASVPCPAGNDQKTIVPTKEFANVLSGPKKSFFGASIVNTTLTSRTLNGSTVSTFSEIDGTFPNYQQVIPDFGEGGRTRIKIGAKYLKLIAEYAIKHAKRNRDSVDRDAAWIVLGVKDDSSPLTAAVEIDPGNEDSAFPVEAKFVLMPAKLNK